MDGKEKKKGLIYDIQNPYAIELEVIDRFVSNNKEQLIFNYNYKKVISNKITHIGSFIIYNDDEFVISYLGGRNHNIALDIMKKYGLNQILKEKYNEIFLVNNHLIFTCLFISGIYDNAREFLDDNKIKTYSKNEMCRVKQKIRDFH